MLITAIRQTAPGRLTVCLEDGTEIKSTLSAVTDLRLYSGRELDEDELSALRLASARSLSREKALELLSREYPLAIVSNKPDAAVKPLCAAYFPGVYARGESADCPRKPAPDMVRRAMEAVGADTCVYVGDSEVDVLTAANAGVPCLSVLWGFRGKAELAAAGGKHFCEDPRKLVSAVRQLIREKEGSQNGK